MQSEREGSGGEMKVGKLANQTIKSRQWQMHSTSETEAEAEQKKVEWMKKKNKDKATTYRGRWERGFESRLKRRWLINQLSAKDNWELREWMGMQSKRRREVVEKWKLASWRIKRLNQDSDKCIQLQKQKQK